MGKSPSMDFVAQFSFIFILYKYSKIIMIHCVNRHVTGIVYLFYRLLLKKL